MGFHSRGAFVRIKIVEAQERIAAGGRVNEKNPYSMYHLLSLAIRAIIQNIARAAISKIRSIRKSEIVRRPVGRLIFRPHKAEMPLCIPASILSYFDPSILDGCDDRLGTIVDIHFL